MTHSDHNFNSDEKWVYRQDHLLVRARWRIVGLALLLTVITALFFPLTEVLVPAQNKKRAESQEKDEESLTEVRIHRPETTPDRKTKARSTARTAAQPDQPQERRKKKHKRPPVPVITPEVRQPAIEPELTVAAKAVSNPAPLRKPQPQIKMFPVTEKEPSRTGEKPKEDKPAAGAASQPQTRTGPYKVSALDKSPRASRQRRPVYPTDAKRRDMEGFVKVAFVVTDMGKVRDAQVIDADPKGVFNNAALRSVRQWRFSPGEKDGQPVNTRVQIKIRFRLE